MPLRTRRVFAFTLIELLVVIAVIAILAALLLPGLSRAKSEALSVKCKSNLKQLGFALSLYLQDYKKYPLYDGLEGNNIEPVPFWDGLVLPYVSNNRLVFTCPVNLNLAPWTNSPWAGRIGGVERTPNFSYGYNYSGTGFFPTFVNPLGLDGGGAPLPENQVLVPGDMVAICDYTNVPVEFDDDSDDFPQGNILSRLTALHNKGANAAFCEGHVEYGKQRSWTKPTAAARQRWNNDHQPHPFTWFNDPN